MSTYGKLTPSQRDAQVMRAISDCRGYGAQWLAVQEQHQAAYEDAERRRLLSEAGLSSPRIGSSLTALRAALGSALIRLGAYLGGGVAVDASTNAVANAG